MNGDNKSGRGLETYLCLELPVCFCFSFFFDYTNNVYLENVQPPHHPSMHLQ